MRRRLPLRENAFATVTDDSAYWTGFLMADGCVVRDPHGQMRVQVVLADVDRSHLTKLRDFLGSGHRISTVQYPAKSIRGRPVRAATGVSFRVRSDRLAEDLSRYGVTPNKTHRECVAGLENNRDFWRGYVDGDGCIRLSHSYHGIWPAIEVVGSYQIVSQFANYVNSIVPTSVLTPHRLRQSPSTFSVGACSWTAVAVVKNLYRGAVTFLDRKMVRANEILGWTGTRRAAQ